MSTKTEKINSLFENLKQHEFIEGRKVSIETTMDNGETKPLIELQPSSDNTKLILKFIRSKNPDYTLDDLMAGFFCYARENGFTSVGLEDDALFSDGDCKFRALTFRVFQNKKSIYDKFGYKPKLDITGHLKILNSLKLTESIQILKNLTGMDSLVERAKSFGDDALFSDFIVSLDCEPRRTFLNRLDELALKFERNSSQFHELNADAKAQEYLTKYREYVKAHEEMTAMPLCSSKGGKRKSSYSSPTKRGSGSKKFGSKKRKPKGKAKSSRSRTRGSRGSRRLRKGK